MPSVRDRREMAEAMRLRQQRRLRETILAEALDCLRLQTALLMQCKLYKGYENGPAREPAVEVVVKRSLTLLASAREAGMVRGEE